MNIIKEDALKHYDALIKEALGYESREPFYSSGLSESNIPYGSNCSYCKHYPFLCHNLKAELCPLTEKSPLTKKI